MADDQKHRGPVQVETRLPDLAKNIPIAPDSENVQQRRPLPDPSENISTAASPEIKVATVDFTGEWLPNVDPARLGINNFATLTNYRYAKNTGIEGILGYTKINTTTALQIGGQNVKIRNGHQLTAPYTVGSYFLAWVEDSVGATYVYQNQTAIPSQGDFSGTALHTDATGGDLGRFANAPGGNVVYCNTKESQIWAGEETRIPGFYTITIQPATSHTDLTFGAGPPGTIGRAAGSFITEGYSPGQRVDITACSIAANIKKVTVKTVVALTLTIVESLTAGGAGAGTATMQAIVNSSGYTDPIDYTEAVNNSLTTSGNIATLAGGNDSNTLVLLTMDGADGSTTFTNIGAGLGPASATANGNAKVDTSDLVFGTGSVVFDGTGDYLAMTDSHGADDWFEMGTGRFTIDFWLKADISALEGIFQQYDGVDDYVRCWRNGTVFVFEIRSGGVDTLGMTSQPGAIQIGNWYHITILRGYNDNNNDWAILKDGIPMDVETGDADPWPDLAADFEIGRANISGLKYLQGHIDEFRVSKGITRWTTAPFAIPSGPYRMAQLDSIILATRPLQGINVDLSTVNTTTSTIAVKYWNGAQFVDVLNATDNTSTGGVSLGQDGTITWTDTDEISKLFHFENTYLYAYLMTLSAGEADIAQITNNANFQSIKSVWDGVYRTVTQFQLFVNASDVYQDWTLEVAESSSSDAPVAADISSMTTSDFIIIMSEERLSGLQIDMIADKINTNTSVPTVEYWNGMSWVSVGAVSDGTISNAQNWQIFGQSGLLSWDPPAEHEEFKQTLFGTNGYSYKITVSDALSATIKIDRVTGIPAQKTVRPFKFPVEYKDLVLLCAFTEGDQGNRVDYCLTNAADVWHGTETSDDGLQSLFFGNIKTLNCGIQLYNRFGSSIFATAIMLNDTECFLLDGTGPDNFRIFPISYNVGCAAPLTLFAAEMGFELDKGVNRNIVGWLSYVGPIIFDGAAIFPIPGIENFFEQSNAEFINFSAIETSRMWYDTTNGEINLLIPTGAATVPDIWLAFNLRKQRWFEKEPPTYLRFGIGVLDLNGARYTYGGRDDGRLMRLENGNDWDGTAIDCTWETGDFLPTGDPWDITKIRRLKYAGKDTTEAVDMEITHYTDTFATATTLTDANISFTGTDKINITGGNDFLSSNFKVGQNVDVTGTASNNKAFDIDSINDAGTQMIVSGNTVTTEGASAGNTITVSHDVKFDIDGSSNRIFKGTTAFNRTAWMHRLKGFASGSSTGRNMQPLLCSIQYTLDRNDE